jgi:hypothetical protein
MKRPCGLLVAAGNGDERAVGAGDGAVATVRVAKVIATASGDAQAGQNRPLSGASAPHPAQRIILCILPHFAGAFQKLVSKVAVSYQT